MQVNSVSFIVLSQSSYNRQYAYDNYIHTLAAVIVHEANASYSTYVHNICMYTYVCTVPTYVNTVCNSHGQIAHDHVAGLCQWLHKHGVILFLA